MAAQTENREPRFGELIRSCCEDNCAENFSRFQLFSRDFLVAVLTQCSNDWQVVEAVCETTYRDFRQLFQDGFVETFDYWNFFCAVGYAHLLQRVDTSPLRSLVSRLLGSRRIEELNVEQTVAVFAALLHLERRCRFDFLMACFCLRVPEGLTTLYQDCDSLMRKTLVRIFG